ncbi:beta-1,3-N-acetylglucosaminyltransferase manic fringe-like [Dysidea avara]|uniref:beta-1,3-N-acetylglucosaminyltransferase manic fringe-like n=1 Tax=Dysidea avara TaxID=196820 RepID=UPI003323572B
MVQRRIYWQGFAWGGLRFITILCCAIVILSALVHIYNYIQGDYIVTWQPKPEEPANGNTVLSSTEDQEDSSTVVEHQVESNQENINQNNKHQIESNKKTELPDNSVKETELLSDSNSPTVKVQSTKEVHSDSTIGTDKVKSATETKLQEESPTINHLSSIGFSFDSNHINGKLLEPVDIQWDKNIYFSVKTTTKNFKTRLSYLIATWFQVVNKKMLTIVSEISDEGTEMAKVMKEAGFNLLLTDCDAGHTFLGLCCKTGCEYEAYYEALEKYKDEQDSFQWFCHFDDDMYVNVPELSSFLRQHDPAVPYYVGSSDDPKYVHTLTDSALEGLQNASIKVVNKQYQLTSGCSYCISHSLMMEMKPYANGKKVLSDLCVMTGIKDDWTVGMIIVSLLGHHRDIYDKVKTQQTRTYLLARANLEDMKKYVCVASTGTRQRNLESYARTINLPLSEDPMRFLAYHCLLYPTVSWCH